MVASDSAKPKILVVDDETDNLDLLYRTFYRDYTVLRAESGSEALALLEQEGEVAVIISDQRMPSMSGTEFLSLTAKQYPDIIRIILTGYTDVGDLVEAINAGKVFKYVTKPWDDEDLKALVRQAVDTHNVLKARTQDLQRTLRQETLLNAITNTIRSAPSYRQILQTIVETVGHMFEVDCCIIRPFQDGQMDIEPFIYLAQAQGGEATLCKELANTLAQTVWETRDILVVQDAATDERLLGLADSPLQMVPPKETIQAFTAANIMSSVIVPLVCQQDLVAVLALHQFGQPRTWRDDEVQLAVMVADQAALALSQAYAFEQARALARRETLVNTITSAIRSSLEPQEIFAAITQQLGQALAADGCALSLWTEGDEYVQCVGLHDTTHSEEVAPKWDAFWPELTSPRTSGGLNRGAEDTRQHALPQSMVPIEGNPVLQHLLATQSPVIIDDLDEHPELNTPDLPLRSPARALLVVPLLADGRIIGSISLRQAHEPRHWKPEEVDLAQAVAVQAAIAVQQSRLYQKTRQQAEQLLELDRQKTEFFQNISHEFRTPLTLTIGPLESAVSQGQGLSYEQADIALRNSRRLLRLVNQLLDLQRLDAGRMQPSFRPCNLLDFVVHIVDSFRPYCDRKHIQLNTNLRDCPPVYLDLERFDKVLYNLLSNAMKFTPSGGTISVSVYPRGEHCQIKVQDTGIGIREDQIPYLFERFRQADGSTNRSYEGTGLGLSLVKELVELHGGRVSVDSTYGEGSTFTIWVQTGFSHLPLDQVIEVPAEIEHSRAMVELADVEVETAVDGLGKLAEVGAVPMELANARAFSPSEGIRILVVDDNTDMRTYVSSILQQAGYTVLTARNGAEGLEVAQTEIPNLIVTDLMMPMVSGLEMIQWIRHNEALKGTPVILVTAKADEETRIEGVEKGADGYLSKPFNARELLAEVRNLLALKENERRVAELNSYLTESVLKRFLPPSLVERAAAGELALDLRPEPRMITVLFSDIIGFTQLSNTLRSRRVAELLNEYLTEMTHAIFEHGGTVDKFMGDAILAIFGAPEEISPNEQVHRAIAAARQMYKTLDLLNAKWVSRGIIPEDYQVQFRCGIHQGTAVVGMFGGEERTDYTAIGPSVNIAARIQEAAEANSILVSAAVADYLDQDTITKFSPLELKGVDETVLTFSIRIEH
ncbi:MULTISPECIES: response regulator [unclassified Leptolyngbya]|uniref:response regulator n=1 Tax=unclassified Leptolyngbya TaxID=2650499 RepID=UPI0016823ED8|nr:MULTISPECIES: response regulator [unclassified Leptolyngbya]MBD1912227.1 response regulator [Leptolyngbya sp. FACHB-8]MBD2155118.1 response regulator [Leptolyngbya sp. FACHB-16]